LGALGLTSDRDPGTGARPLAASGETRRPKPGASAPALTGRRPHSSGEGLDLPAAIRRHLREARPQPPVPVAESAPPPRGDPMLQAGDTGHGRIVTDGDSSTCP
jgi:hypothetical protein